MLSCFCHVQLFATPWTVATRLLCSWDSPGKNTGVGCHALLQGIFLTRIKLTSLTSPALAGEFFTTSCTWATLWPNNEGGLSEWIVYWATYSCKTSWPQETQKSIFFQSWVPILPLLMCFFSGSAFAEWLRAQTLKSALQLCHLQVMWLGACYLISLALFPYL